MNLCFKEDLMKPLYPELVGSPVQRSL